MGDFLCVQPFVGKIEDHPEQIQISLKIPICNSVRMSFGAFLLFSGLPLPVRFRMSPVSAGCPSKRKSPCSADCRLKTMPSPKNHKNRVLKYPSAFLPCYTSFWNDRCFFGYSGKLNQRTPLVILIIDRVYFIIVPSKSVNKELLLLTFW